jgi:hypothetical protein
MAAESMADDKNITLRVNYGSYPTVTRVLAVDLDSKRATVRLRYIDGTRSTETLPFSELEAFDENRRYVLLEPILRQRALEEVGGPVRAA